MNKLIGTIINIQQSGAIMLADIEVYGQTVSALLIHADEQDEWLKVGNTVTVAFKETEMSIAKGLSGSISLRNRFRGVVEELIKGELLSEVKLRYGLYSLTSVITTRSAEALSLKVGDEVEALVKANEVSLMKIN
jgi:molybdenum-pterin binding domain